MGRAQRAHQQKKKELADALEYAAKKNATNHPKIKAIELARLINLQCGGAVIAPWEVEQLDDEWVSAFTRLPDLPKLRESYQAFEKRLQEIRRAHPNYRKYLS